MHNFWWMSFREYCVCKKIMTKDNIIELVESLVEEHDERDPFALCECLDIFVMMYDFTGEIQGYCFTYEDVQSVVINNNLNRFMKKYICAHELGHLLMHDYFAKHIDVTVYDMTAKPEYEANLFAAELLITDESVFDLLETYPNYYDVAKELSVSIELLNLKVQLLRHKGHKLNPVL